MRHATILVAVLAFTPLTSATAQVGQPPIVRGERVRIAYHLCPPTHAGCFGPPQLYVGTFVTWNADTLVVESNGDTIAVPQDSVTTLEVREQVSQAGVGAGIGGGIGAFIGAGVGAASCTDPVLGDSGACALAGALVVGIGGAMLGSIVGAITKTERWVSVPLDRIRVGLGPQRDGGFVVGMSVGF